MPRPGSLRLVPILAGLLLAPALLAQDRNPGDEPPRPLEGRALDNLVAFSRLLGYVQYFHPSDAAAEADWNAFALEGVRAVEAASSAEDLARRLADLFAPVAPTVQVFPAGSAPEPHPGLRPPAADAAIVGWRHLGVELPVQKSTYSSRRVDDKTPLLDNPATLMLEVDPKNLAGRKLRLRAWARTEGLGPGAGAGLRMVGLGGRDGNLQADMNVRGTEWQEYELTGQLPDDAEVLYLGVLLKGAGRAWIDQVSLDAGRPDGTWESVPLKNAGFDQEDPGKKGRPAEWGWVEERKGDSHEIGLAESGCREGRCLALTGKPVPPPVLPKPSEVFQADLGGGVSVRVPLTLYRDGQGATVPAAAGWSPPKGARPEGWKPSGKDRATRLAGVALAWNVFQHFYPYFDVVKTDWPAVLRSSLAAAAQDRGEQEFLETLRVLVAQLQDGHGSAGLAAQNWDLYGSLPLGLRWVEDKVAVAAVMPGKAGRVRPGDVILEIDGVPIAEALAKAERIVSAATPQWRKWVAVNRLALGLKSDAVQLKIQPFQGEPYQVSLPRDLPPPFPEETRPEKIAEIRPGIFYVDLGRINDEDFKGAVDKLAAARGVVFDLRGYPAQISTVVLAHLTDKPVTSAQWHVPILTRPDREGMEFRFSNWEVEPQKPRFQGKVAFLTDGRAISYAETYMGIVEHYRLAEIVGGPTAGTNGNVNPFELPGGYRVNWTGMKVLKHDGSRHHGIGILPTVPVAPTLQGLAEGRDEVLEKGIEVVSR